MTVAERIGRGRFVSFELWPPRSPESAAALEEALAGLSALRPAFVASARTSWSPGWRARSCCRWRT